MPFTPGGSPNTNQGLDIARLFDEYESRLHRYAHRLTRDDAAASDLVQETFVRAMSNMNQLQSMNPHQRQAWMYKVLKNRFLDQYRSRQREQALMQRLADLTEEPYDLATNLTVQGAMERVPEIYREVLHMRYALDMSSEQIGMKLGIPSATVRSRLHLAMKWLRTHQSWFK